MRVPCATCLSVLPDPLCALTHFRVLCCSFLLCFHTDAGDHKMHLADPDGMTIDQSGLNKEIWKSKVRMPIDDDAERVGITYDKDGCMTMRDYLQLLCAFFERDIEDPFFPGQAMMFRGRFIPMLWPSFIRFPKSLEAERRKVDDIIPTEKYNLGKHCCPPLRGFIVGPSWKNKLMVNKVALLWFKPLIIINVAVMNLQYSPFSPWQIMDNALTKFAVYRGGKKIRKIGKGVMKSRGWNVMKNTSKIGTSASGADNGENPSTGKGKIMIASAAVNAFQKAGAGKFAGKLVSKAKSGAHSNTMSLIVGLIMIDLTYSRTHSAL